MYRANIKDGGFFYKCFIGDKKELKPEPRRKNIKQETKEIMN